MGSTATASAGVPADTQITTGGGQGDTTSWQTYGYKSAGQHIDFVVDNALAAARRAGLQPKTGLREGCYLNAAPGAGVHYTGKI